MLKRLPGQQRGGFQDRRIGTSHDIAFQVSGKPGIPSAPKSSTWSGSREASLARWAREPVSLYVSRDDLRGREDPMG